MDSGTGGTCAILPILTIIHAFKAATSKWNMCHLFQNKSPEVGESPKSVIDAATAAS